MSTDNEAKLKLYGRAMHAAGIAVCLATCLVTYFFVFRPIVEAANDSAAGSEQLQQLLRSAPRVRTEFAETNHLATEAGRRAAEAEQKLPAQPHEADFLAEISNLAHETGLRIQDYRPGAIKSANSCSQMEIGVVGQGTYESICRFLDGLTRLPRLSTLSRLEIKSQDADGGHVVSLRMMIYFGAKKTADAPQREVKHG